MTKKKIAALEHTRKGRLGAVVVGQAEVVARRLAATKDPKVRAELERRLEAAYVALRPRWTVATAQAEVLGALDLPRRTLARGLRTEAKALTWALERVAGVLADPYAPDDCAGRKVPRELVRAYLHTEPGRRGRPRDGRQSEATAAHALLVALGLSGAADGSAVNQLRSRRRRRP